MLVCGDMCASGERVYVIACVCWCVGICVREVSVCVCSYLSVYICVCIQDVCSHTLVCVCMQVRQRRLCACSHTLNVVIGIGVCLYINKPYTPF